MFEEVMAVFQNINIIVLLTVVFLPGYITLFTIFNSKNKPKNFPQWNEFKLLDKIIWCILTSMILMFILTAILQMVLGAKEINTTVAISSAILICIIAILYNWASYLTPKIKKGFYKTWLFFPQLNQIYDKIHKMKKTATEPKIKFILFEKSYYPYYIIIDLILGIIVGLIVVNAYIYIYIAIQILVILSTVSQGTIFMLATALTKIIVGN